jgi:hypothetical protein
MTPVLFSAEEHAISLNSLLDCGSYSSINMNELSRIVAVDAFSEDTERNYP